MRAISDTTAIENKRILIRRGFLHAPHPSDATPPGLAVPSELTRARFLRILSADFARVLLPALSGATANETAYYAMLTLARLAGDDDVVPAAATALAAPYAELARKTIALLADRADANEAALRRSEDGALAPSEQMKLLRAIAADAMRAIADGKLVGREADALGDAIVALEHRWHDLTAEAPAGSASSGNDALAPLTTADIETYLSGHGGTPVVTEIRALPGGRSKTTRLIGTAPGGPFPQAMVMRQDGFGHIATSVVDEHRLLASLAGNDLPIPTMILCEPAPNALGKPFLLMDRLPGVGAGTFSAFEGVDRGYVIQTAQILARLHAMDPRTTALADSATRAQFEASLHAMIDEHEAKWRAQAIDPSPIFEHGFAWARAQVGGLPEPKAIVHGDFRPHNFLVENGALTALLDWEFAHFGDGAEDLAYIRPTVEPIMPWDEYLAAYTQAGGPPCDERTLIFYDIWNVIRLGALGAGAVRAFVDGETDDFCQGAGGYFTKTIFERNLSQLLRRADALVS